MNLRLALEMAQFAQLAYGKTPFPAGLDYLMVDMLPAADVPCLRVRAPKRVTFAVRGTQDLRGWLLDAEIALRPYSPSRPGVKTHTGFWRTVDAAWPRLAPLAEQAHAKGLPVLVTGHSKGAAESCLFTYRLGVERGIIAAGRYSFGEPRSLNRAGSRDYERLGVPTWRVLDEDDVVCRIPWRLGVYRHVGQTAFFNAWGNMQENEPWYAHLPSDVYALVMDALRREDALVRDHAIDLYIDRLNARLAADGEEDAEAA